MECKIESNKEKCPCTNTKCEKHGACCECLRAHISRKTLPACMRKLDWLEVVET